MVWKAKVEEERKALDSKCEKFKIKFEYFILTIRNLVYINT